MRLRNWASILSVSLLCVVPTVVRADTLLVSESGVWDASAPTTLWSAPGEAWSYSFLTSSTALPDDVVMTDYGIHFERDFSDFTYTLGGVSVATDPSSITWYGTAWAGLINVNWGPATSPTMSFEPQGAQVFDSNDTILPGTYAIEPPYSGAVFSDPTDILPLTGDLVITDESAPVVPEPSSLLLLGTGFGWSVLRGATQVLQGLTRCRSIEKGGSR